MFTRRRKCPTKRTAQRTTVLERGHAKIARQARGRRRGERAAGGVKLARRTAGDASITTRFRDRHTDPSGAVHVVRNHRLALGHVLNIMERLAEGKAGFRSLTEAINTTTPAGRQMMQMVGAFAEFERAMLRERTKAGLETVVQLGAGPV